MSKPEDFSDLAEAAIDERPWPRSDDQGGAPRRRQPVATVAVESEKLPPHAIEAEQGVLGCILQDPTACMAATVKALTAGRESFYDSRHQLIYQALLSLHVNGAPIELIPLCQQLKDLGQLENVGGVAYLSSLPDFAPSAANLDYYVDIVRDKWKRRRAIAHGSNLVKRAEDESRPVDDALSQAESECVSIRRGSSLPKSFTAKEAVHKLISYIDELCGDRRPIVSTGFKSLSMVTRGGIHYKDLWVIAGRPGMGKTTLAVNSATRASVGLLNRWASGHQSGAKYAGRVVDFYSFEQPTEVIIEKAVSARAKFGICAEMERSNRFDESNERHVRMREAMRFVADLPLRIHEQRMNIDVFCADVRSRTDTEIVFIDYLQLFLPTKHGQTTIDMVSEVTGKLMELAKECNIPIVLLCQMNRDFERDKSRAPRLSDLRDSGTIEQDAHTVLMLWSDGVDNAESMFGSEQFSEVKVRLAKNRGGAPFQDVILRFYPECSRFEDPTDRI